jgi:serralysin
MGPRECEREMEKRPYGRQEAEATGGDDTDAFPRPHPLTKLAVVMFCASLLMCLAATAQANHRHHRHRHHHHAYAVKQLPPVLYTAFDGRTETLVPWQGRNVSVLVERGVSRDPRVMTRLVRALDRAWSYYANTTGQLPATANSLNGRDEVAEVSSTCGPGCGYIGATGIEIETTYFEEMYRQIAEDNLYDQIPFYELGRNFWLWSDQLRFQSPDQDPVVTGFAVWMRFRSMAAAHVKGAPFNGTPFRTFRSQVAALAGQYEEDPSLTFADTLAMARSPGLYGGTDFWASLMTQLARRHGGQRFVARFWHHAGTLPAASSTTDAVTNWVGAASYAACTDLRPVFYVRWGFPRPDGSVTQRPPSGAVPEPKGRCPGVAG